MSTDGGPGTSLATQTDNLETTSEGNQTQKPAGDVCRPDWATDVPDDVLAVVSKFKTPTDISKSYVELEKKLGGTVQIPGKDATSEERAMFFKKVGRPDSSDGYQLDSLTLPNGQTASAESQKQFKDTALSLHLTQEQARAVYRLMHEAASEVITSAQQQSAIALKAGQEVLHKDWPGDEYALKMALRGKVIQRYGNPGAIDELNKGAGNNPGIVRMLADIGKDLSEDTLEGGTPQLRRTQPEQKLGEFSFPNSPEMTGENRYNRRQR